MRWKSSGTRSCCCSYIFKPTPKGGFTPSIPWWKRPSSYRWRGSTSCSKELSRPT